jgi:hypothetical protein
MLKEAVSHGRGTRLIRGITHIFFATLDTRENLLRASALYSLNIIDHIRQSGIEYTDNVLDLVPSSPYMEFLIGLAKSNRQLGKQEGETHSHRISLDARQERVQRGRRHYTMKACQLLTKIKDLAGRVKEIILPPTKSLHSCSHHP